jgi:hypothetical protein
MVFGGFEWHGCGSPGTTEQQSKWAETAGCQSFPQMRADAECRPGNRAVSPGPGLSWNNAMEHELTE